MDILYQININVCGLPEYSQSVYIGTIITLITNLLSSFRNMYMQVRENYFEFNT